jgi:hypothetical protein
VLHPHQILSPIAVLLYCCTAVLLYCRLRFADTLANKDLKKKMSPTNAKALNTMRQRLKKHNTSEEFADLVTKYRSGLMMSFAGGFMHSVCVCVCVCGEAISKILCAASSRQECPALRPQ